MKPIKNVLMAAILVMAIIVVIQNTESVETKLLFATISMPRALMLLLTLVAGVVLGLLMGTRLGAKRK